MAEEFEVCEFVSGWRTWNVKATSEAEAIGKVRARADFDALDLAWTEIQPTGKYSAEPVPADEAGGEG